jgi:hypothetical protein
MARGGIVVFDSQAATGTGQGVYMSAVATLVEGDGELALGTRPSFVCGYGRDSNQNCR